MADITSLLTSVAILVVALAVLYFVIKASKAIDTLVDHIKKTK